MIPELLLPFLAKTVSPAVARLHAKYPDVWEATVYFSRLAGGVLFVDAIAEVWTCFVADEPPRRSSVRRVAA